ncbi:MAG: insulinase family protein [Salinivirgaceae bacterium]|nr:insulinase family protein [Salinivirgaceae bacterium]
METLNRKNPPVIQQITNINIPKLEKGFLGNGIPYSALSGGSQEFVYMHLTFNAGALYSNQKLVGSFTNNMLTCGTRNHTAQQIADTFDFYGAEIQTSCNPDYANISLFCLNKYADKLLPLFCEIISESVFPESELKIAVANQKYKWTEDHESTKILAKEALMNQTFVNHPYSRSAQLSDFDKLTVDSLRDFHTKHYNSNNCQLIIVGYITNDVMKTIESTIGQMKTGKKVIADNVEIGGTASIKPLIITKDTAVQTSLRMGCSTIKMQHPDYIRLHILLTVLGGYFGSRLMSNIREEKGYTYGISSTIVMYKQAGLLRIASEVKAGFALQVVDEIRKEMQRLKDEPISNEELNLVRNYMTGELIQQFDGPLLSFDQIYKTVAYDIDMSYYTDLQNTIQTISAKDLQDTANKYFDFDRLATVIVGKE